MYPNRNILVNIRTLTSSKTSASRITLLSLRSVVRDLHMGLAVLACALHVGTHDAAAQLTIPSDGSDGALSIALDRDQVIDLSQAVTGKWSADNSANAGKGIYDPEQWAVVFKYSSVSITGTNKLSFKNHPSHAPVVWLVDGDVTIDGTIMLSGSAGARDLQSGLIPAEPGPGGFRGGAWSSLGYGGGYGPEGGNVGERSAGGSYGQAYGGPKILPLMGGSGSAGIRGGAPALSGSAGGGAILIAAKGKVSIQGGILSLGGSVGNRANATDYYTTAGSGAVRIVANELAGNGFINAGNGRTRTEANVMSPELTITPNSVAVPPGGTPQIWPEATAPTARVLSVHDQTSPAVPLADVRTTSDINLQTNGIVDIVIETRNFPPNGAVNLRVIPKYEPFRNVAATYVSGTFNQSTWKASTTLPQGFCVLQAHATSP